MRPALSSLSSRAWTPWPRSPTSSSCGWRMMTRLAAKALTRARSSASKGLPRLVTTCKGGLSSSASPMASSIVSLSTSARSTTGRSNVPARSDFATAICFSSGTSWLFQLTMTV